MIALFLFACMSSHPQAEQRETLWQEFKAACATPSPGSSETLDRIAKERTELDKGTEYSTLGWYCYPDKNGAAFEEDIEQHLSSEPWR